MKHLVIGLVVAAGLHSGLAAAQSASNAASGPGHDPMAKKPDVLPVARARSDFQSPFSDYRPFTPQEPQKSWRAANDEVRDAGGHAGLMKRPRGREADVSKGGKP